MSNWAAFHVFFPGPLDRLLVGVVAPVLAETAAPAFFLRYWNGGPHVRLRVQGGPPAEDLRRRLEQLVAGLGPAAPGTPAAPAYPDTGALRAADRAANALAGYAAEAVEPMQPSPSVQPRPYRFDAERFGGEAARPLVERHFHRSTRLALKVVAATAEDPAARCSLALHLVANTAAVLEGIGEPARPLLELAARGATLLGLGGGDPAVDRLAPTGDEARRLAAAEAPPPVRALLGFWRDSLLDVAGRWPGPRPGPVLLDLTHLTMNRLGVPVDVECRWYAVAAGLPAHTGGTR